MDLIKDPTSEALSYTSKYLESVGLSRAAENYASVGGRNNVQFLGKVLRAGVEIRAELEKVAKERKTNGDNSPVEFDQLPQEFREKIANKYRLDESVLRASTIVSEGDIMSKINSEQEKVYWTEFFHKLRMQDLEYTCVKSNQASVGLASISGTSNSYG